MDMKLVQVAFVTCIGLGVVSCSGAGEGPIVPPPPAPAEYADKHMPAGWWTDEKLIEEGRLIFIGPLAAETGTGTREVAGETEAIITDGGSWGGCAPCRIGE